MFHSSSREEVSERVATTFLRSAMVNDGVNVTANNVTMPLTHCEQGGAAGASLGIGIFLGTLGSVLINIGQNLQSSGMMGRPDVQKKPCTSRTWVIGMTTFAVGAVINFLAFAFAPASILVPIEAIQFVVNVIWGKFVNKKNISMRMLVGVTLAIIGTLMCVIFGPSANRCFSLKDLIDLWLMPTWWAYVVISFGVAFWSLHTYNRYQRAERAGRPLRNSIYVLPVNFAVSSALLGGGQMIVHSKAIAELLELQFALVEPYPMTTWYFYVEFFLLFFGGFYWLYKMNEGIGLFDPLFIIPLLQSCYILFGVIAGGIFFEEFAGLRNGPFGIAGWPLFIIGMASLLWGLYLIAPPQQDAEDFARRKTREVSVHGSPTLIECAESEKIHTPLSADEEAVEADHVALDMGQLNPMKIDSTSHEVPLPTDKEEPNVALRRRDEHRRPSSGSKPERVSRNSSSSSPREQLVCSAEGDEGQESLKAVSLDYPKIL